MNLLSIGGHVHGTLERLVNAMLAPGLRQRLQFDIRGLSFESAEVLLNGLHLDYVQEQVLLPTEGFETGVVEVPDGPVNEVQLVRFQVRTWWFCLISDHDVLDHVVGEDLSGDRVDLVRPDLAEKNVLAGGPHHLRHHTHIRDGRHDRLRDRVGDPALEVHLNQRGPRQPCRRAAATDIVLLADGIGQKFAGDSLREGAVEIPLDQKHPRRLNGLHRCDPQLTNVLQHTAARNIRQARPAQHLKTPLCHGSSSFFLILY